MDSPQICRINLPRLSGMAERGIAALRIDCQSDIFPWLRLLMNKSMI